MRKEKEGNAIPRCFISSLYPGSVNVGIFLDDYSEKMFQVAYLVQEHTIQERALWKGEHEVCTANIIKIGQINGNLYLREFPKGEGKPARFEWTEKGKEQDYFVAYGRAWNAVRNLILAKAFDKKNAIKLEKRIGDNFKKKAKHDYRAFYSKFMQQIDGGQWYLDC